MSTAILTQPLAALQSANHIRAERSHLKKRWKQIGSDAARRELRTLILDPTPVVDTWRLDAALSAIPGVGSTKIHRLTERLGIDRETPLRKLKVRERLAVAEWLVG